MPDPAETLVASVSRSLAALGARLVDIEADPTVELARSGSLTGGSAATWAEADADLARAWEVYRTVDDLVRQAEADPDRGWLQLETARVPGPDGPARPVDALAAAEAAVDRAAAVIARLLVAWDQLAARTTAAGTRARAAAAADVERSVTALAELLASDPLAVTEADVADLERRAAEAEARHTAARTASARVALDLDQARRQLTDLAADLEAAAGELDHASSRIAGLGRPDPVPDLDALGQWLDRIAAEAETRPDRAAAALDDWRAAADERRAALDAALERARAAMRRRDEARGLWKALRAKAGARKLDERPDVADALQVALDEVRRGPCDLDRAEAALARLSTLLSTRPGGAR
ncbi:MAG TPA: hypothetical protein VIL48_03325 [Acidimicrobiales bacterium]